MGSLCTLFGTGIARSSPPPPPIWISHPPSRLNTARCASSTRASSRSSLRTGRYGSNTPWEAGSRWCRRSHLRSSGSSRSSSWWRISMHWSWSRIKLYGGNSSFLVTETTSVSLKSIIFRLCYQWRTPMGYWMGLTGFLRFDFDEGLITLMDFWGLILVYGFLLLFSFSFLVMNLWVSHWMGFNGFLEFDFDEGWIRVNLSGLEKLCNLWSLAKVLVDVW